MDQVFAATAPEVWRVKEAAERILNNVNQVIVGKVEKIQLVLIALLCEGHVLS